MTEMMMSANEVLLANVDFKQQLFTSLWSEETKSPATSTDTVLKCKDSSVAAHSLYLKQCCSLFRQVLAGHNNDSEFVMLLPDFEAKIVAKFLELLYTGRADMSSSEELETVTDLVSLMTVQASQDPFQVWTKKDHIVRVKYRANELENSADDDDQVNCHKQRTLGDPGLQLKTGWTSLVAAKPAKKTCYTTRLQGIDQIKHQDLASSYKPIIMSPAQTCLTGGLDDNSGPTERSILAIQEAIGEVIWLTRSESDNDMEDSKDNFEDQSSWMNTTESGHPDNAELDAMYYNDTGNDKDNITLSSSGTNEVKPQMGVRGKFDCNYCVAKFRDNWKLSRHIRGMHKIFRDQSYKTFLPKTGASF